ncbi:bifunctional diaminohydroxyphosphoribosylaminopyrimidine deaminase/5-amino-6-(5-phosphoribosylamino)uracil reductase RibD [Candidatus Bipolaricaulota bacterium]|nr:bifunctional diaminohydroxyphosphoribosylaminopyrimidine deaminase/5-amino-6-(5-phosphoribosylamino)uracil reductase RibD [Candidatus Bipolaricaulota bacterium]
MRRALALARKGEGFTRPNPLVGAVVVKDGEILAEAYHERFGGPHAEVLALEKAGEKARDAELYVNLEPCVDFPGKKTPSCTEAIIRAGIKRVFVATRDPNPHVCGRGLARLREAGVEVVEGVLAEEAKKLNEIFFHWITARTPFVALKLALTLDGKIASYTGKSKWITGEEARRVVQGLRRRYAAVLVGTNTVLADDPELTVREFAGPQPLRVVLDPHGRIPLTARVFSGTAKTLVVTADMSPEKEEALKARGVEVLRAPDREGKVDLARLLLFLAEREVDSLLVEGGGEVAWSFLSQGLVHKIYFFYAPIILGGRNAVPAVGGEGFPEPAQALPIKGITLEWVGKDLLLTGYTGTARLETLGTKDSGSGS